MSPARLCLLTLVAMIAFASNWLLCRLALKQTSIDAATFTFVRIVSGAIALWLILRTRRRRPDDRNHPPPEGNWFSALALFVYAAAFSFAYISLSAGTGASLLFGAVQATMILWGVHRGERLSWPQVAGLCLALGGLVALLFPGLTAPSPGGSILMLAAGVAWGAYSLRGKATADPVAATAGNFSRAVPMAAVLAIVLVQWARWDWTGTGYAMLSGAVASGLGYVIWYSALPGLRAASAATVQLSVPVLTAFGGVLLLGEQLNLRLIVSSITVLGGIGLVVKGGR